MRNAVAWGRVWRVSTAVMAIHLVAACGPAVETVERRDSLGVAIVESHAPTWGVGPSWQLDTSPRLSLGRDDAEPAELFHRIVAMVRQPNGDVAVMDGATQELRLFDSAGRHRWTFGRRGGGPGEFRQVLTLLRWPGDSLAVFDFMVGRITVVSPDGKLGRITTVLAGGPGVHGLQIVDDSILVAKAIMMTALSGSGHTRIPAAIVTTPLARLDPDTIAIVPGEETMLLGGGGSGGILYGKDAALAVAGSAIVVGTAERLEIMWFDGAGRVAQLSRVPGFDLSIPSAERAAERQFLLGANPTPQVVARVDAMPVLTMRPAYRSLIGDPTGAVWAEPHRLFSDPEGPRPWQVFAPTGEWLGPFQMPPRFRPFDIGPDYLLGIQTDSMGVERVRLFRLNRA